MKAKSPIIETVIPAHVECDEFSTIEFTIRGRHFTRATELHVLGHATGHQTRFVSSEELRGLCDVYGSEWNRDFVIGLIVVNDPKSFQGGCSNLYPISVTFTERQEAEASERDSKIPF